MDVSTIGRSTFGPKTRVSSSYSIHHGLCRGSPVETETPSKSSVRLRKVDNELDAVGTRTHPILKAAERKERVNRI